MEFNLLLIEGIGIISYIEISCCFLVQINWRMNGTTDLANFDLEIFVKVQDKYGSDEREKVKTRKLASCQIFDAFVSRPPVELRGSTSKNNYYFS